MKSLGVDINLKDDDDNDYQKLLFLNRDVEVNVSVL